MTTHSIRVHNYACDRDAMTALHIIGPYPTKAARDADLERLADIPDKGFIQLETSRISPKNADKACTPDAVAAAKTWEDIIDAFY